MKPFFLTSHDNLQLAYYPFVPTNPKAIIVFYHGGGAWSTPMYQVMATAACERYGIAVYLVDIRGHGHSEGPRGDAPSPQHVWNDVDAFLDMVAKKHPDVPVILTGHSSGAGLILNYCAQAKMEKADGYIFLAPYLGNDTALKHKNSSEKFVPKISLFKFMCYGLTGGKLFAHKPAVFFNYAALQDAKTSFNTDSLLLAHYTPAMATAVFPRNAKAILKNLTKPCALFIGKNDEQFNAHRVVAYQKCLQNNHSFSRIIANANHLSIIAKAPDLLEEAIRKFAYLNIPQ